MKIGIEAQRIFRRHKHGMDFVALEMIRHLQQIDHINQYVIFTNKGEDICLRETDNFKIVSFKASYPVWEQLKLPEMCRRYGVELLHCTSNTAPVKTGIPLIITLHDIIYFEKNPFFTRGYTSYQRFGNMYRRLVVRRILRKASQIITVSQFEKNRISQQLDFDASKIKVIYNGVGRHFVKGEYRKDEVRKKYNLPDSYFLFLGNTDPKKNTRNTVLAFARYAEQHNKDACLVVADLPPEKVKEYLQEANLQETFTNFYFTGYIYNRDLPTVIHLADIFLYPSKRESFGLPLLEAMASRTPVITSNTSSMPEIAAGAALLVEPLDINNICEAMNTLYNDRSLQSDLVNKGLERVKDFNWKTVAESVLEVYREVLSSSTSS